MKKRLLSLALAMVMVTGFLPTQSVMAAESTSAIEELEVKREINDVEETQELIEWGKYPGLNVDILHKYGFTGEGVTVAYIDSPFDNHEEIVGANIHYTNNAKNINNKMSVDTMHGSAVISLLVGEEIGMIPDAEVYYYAHASWEADQKTHAECLYQIVEQNKKLPTDQKITMVGFSDNIDPTEKNSKLFQEAVEYAEKNDVMVWFCGEYMMASFIPFSDKNDYGNLVLEDHLENVLYIPSSRTVADLEGYTYWEDGGVSWVMPYALGLYGIAKEINPTLTEEQLRESMLETAYVQDGLKIINPVGFIAEILMGVGRTQEAKDMLAEVDERNEYLYVLINPTLMSDEDLTAVSNYLSQIPETILLVDTSNFINANDIYNAMKQDALTRGGAVKGVQIFGTNSMIPAFEIRYKAQMLDGVHDGGSFVTDLFYGNFNNDEITSDYNIMDHFANNMNIDLVPEWPVVRLPLAQGEYTNFFNNYFSYYGNERPTLVNFSNPIFASNYHTDDMTYFLKRMDNEFKLLDDYRLYANEIGDYPIRSTLGGFTSENLSLENKKGVVEFLINTHGQWDNIDKCYFVNGREVRESLINMNNINYVLSDNVYYLDMWACLNGYGMENNITTTALSGKCIGMFAATEVISNNGVNCFANLEDMKDSNFYWFYYNYLKALHEGSTRHEAFYNAQAAYGNAVLEDSKNGIRANANYQFNLYNLLVYHNFGVMDLTESYISEFCETECRISKPGGIIGITHTYGKATSTSMLLMDREGVLPNGYNVFCSCYQKLDNGYYRVTVEHKMLKDMTISFLYTTEDDTENEILVDQVEDEKRYSLRFDILDDEWETIKSMGIKYQIGEIVYIIRYK